MAKVLFKSSFRFLKKPLDCFFVLYINLYVGSNLTYAIFWIIFLFVLLRFEANFGQQTVMFTFKCVGLPEVQPGQIRILRKGNKMEVLVWGVALLAHASMRQ